MFSPCALPRHSGLFLFCILMEVHYLCCCLLSPLFTSSPLKVFFLRLYFFFFESPFSHFHFCSLVFPSLTQPIIGYLLKHRLEPGRLYSRSDEKGSMGLSSMALRGIQGSWTGDCVAGKGCSECQTWLRDCLRKPTKGSNF